MKANRLAVLALLLGTSSQIKLNDYSLYRNNNWDEKQEVTASQAAAEAWQEENLDGYVDAVEEAVADQNKPRKATRKIHPVVHAAAKPQSNAKIQQLKAASQKSQTKVE